MIKQKNRIINDNNIEVEAQTPIIISASRSTDIPAFYSDWFVNRFKKGYLRWMNPFNRAQPIYVSFSKTRLIVFWSKNPKLLIKHLDYFDKKGINYYFQFTVNDYEKEKLEPNVPDLDERIKTFINLSKKIGKEKVIWRFDPLILTDNISIDDLIIKIKYIGDKISTFTQKLVISFADLQYKKVQHNLKKENIKYKDFDTFQMKKFADKLQQLNKDWKLKIGTCAEEINLKKFSIEHNKCIDDDLMIENFNEDIDLMAFLGYEKNIFGELEKTKNKRLKDKGQRKACGCIQSKDIGQYNTCPHNCTYCYANTSIDIVLNNFKKHNNNPNCETIIGD